MGAIQGGVFGFQVIMGQAQHASITTRIHMHTLGVYTSALLGSGGSAPLPPLRRVRLVAWFAWPLSPLSPVAPLASLSLSAVQ